MSIIFHHISPYPPVIGSLKSGIFGVMNINRMNNVAIRQIIIKHSHGALQSIVFFINKRHSMKYETAAEMKNIAIFKKSGDLPKTPLYV